MMMMKCEIHWWRKPEHPEETTDLPQVTDKTFTVTLKNVTIILQEYSIKAGPGPSHVTRISSILTMAKIVLAKGIVVFFFFFFLIALNENIEDTYM